MRSQILRAEIQLEADTVFESYRQPTEMIWEEKR